METTETWGSIHPECSHELSKEAISIRTEVLEERHRCHGQGMHEHHHEHTPEEMAIMQKKQEQLMRLKPHMAKIQALHDKIDAVLGKVEQNSIGLLLTQKKNIKELKKEYELISTGKLGEILPPAILQAEQAYIANIEEILHCAKLFKRGGQGNVTAEVIRNLERSL